MPLGPFDRRKRRFRCRHCSASHLKCSGNLPCSNCEKRGVTCGYPDSGAKPRSIEIDKGTQKTAASFVFQVKKSPGFAGPLLKTPRVDQEHFYFHYFDIFLQSNNFGQHGVFEIDTKDMIRSSTREAFLKDAMLSLGAMVSVRLQSTDGPVPNENYRFALTSYAKSVTGLRDALEHHSHKSQLRLNVLWTTLILGLFELMTDSSGQGWVQHLVHGTSKALAVSGPQACQSGPGQRFFTEVKIFEVCRSVVFNEPSFLTQPGWRNLSIKSQVYKRNTYVQPLDELLDMMVCCSSLLIRASDLIDTFGPSESEKVIDIANDIAMEGFCQREALNIWSAANAHFPAGILKSNGAFEKDDFALLAIAFHAAISIYLSGIFDYSIVYWNRLGMVVPTLSEDEVQRHVGNILALSKAILEQTKISPLLLLLPLRVAGARSREIWQQETILKLLGKIEVTFCVAGTFRSDLQKLWSSSC